MQFVQERRTKLYAVQINKEKRMHINNVLQINWNVFLKTWLATIDVSSLVV